MIEREEYLIEREEYLVERGAILDRERGILGREREENLVERGKYLVEKELDNTYYCSGQILGRERGTCVRPQLCGDQLRHPSLQRHC